MYLSLGKAAKEAGVAKSTISKALSSGKLSYREKNSDGYQIDPAELFRVYPKTAKTDADEPSSNDWQPLVPKARAPAARHGDARWLFLHRLTEALCYTA